MMTPVKLKLEEVFRTEGLPEFTFVPPPNYNEILLDVRQSHKPVILEGQSGTGKTSCVRHILDELELAKKPEYLTARDPFHVRRIEKVVTAHLPGSYVIDDFHRLTIDLQEQIANVAKLSADLQRLDLPKLIIIGINQVGTQLIQLVPDIAKRTGIHRISPGRRQDIDKLIQSGCERLDIRIKGAEDIYNETRGDYWLTQQMCQSICTGANVLETQENQTEVTFSLADLRPRVVDKLRSNYYPAVKKNFVEDGASDRATIRTSSSSVRWGSRIRPSWTSTKWRTPCPMCAGASTTSRNTVLRCSSVRSPRSRSGFTTTPKRSRSLSKTRPSSTSSSTSIGISSARTAASGRPRSITSGTLLSHSPGRTGSLPSILTRS